jgi:hypothetical protein
MQATVFKCATLGFGLPRTMDLLRYEHPGHAFDKKSVLCRYRMCQWALVRDLIPTASQSECLLSILNRKKLEEGWICAADYYQDKLIRLFWMDPLMLELFRMYHDVVINDTTLQTNKLGMPLNCFVVVDCEFKTRLVACAITRGETEEDYVWILNQLRLAGEGILPRVIVVDEDLAMDAALPQVFPQAQVINCIWHIQKNIRSHLFPIFGKDRFEDFQVLFYRLIHCITSSEFEVIWAKVLASFGGNGHGVADAGRMDDENPLYVGKAGRYLKRLYERRHHWAGPWIRPVFTAGVRSTQRVEMTNNLIKMLRVDSNTSLPNLFEAIKQKVGNELSRPTVASVTREENGIISKTFGPILKANGKRLSIYAQNEIRKEMVASFCQRSHREDLSRLLVDQEYQEDLQLRGSRVCFSSLNCVSF